MDITKEMKRDTTLDTKKATVKGIGMDIKRERRPPLLIKMVTLRGTLMGLQRVKSSVTKMDT